jgi:hypothetical protein
MLIRFSVLFDLSLRNRCQPLSGGVAEPEIAPRFCGVGQYLFLQLFSRRESLLVAEPLEKFNP